MEKRLPEPIERYLDARIDERAPSSLLWVTRADLEPTAAAANSTATERVEPEDTIGSLGERHFDMAVVADALRHWPRTRGEQLLSRLRDRNAGSVWVVVGPVAESGDDTAWHQADFIALGFRRAPNTRELSEGWTVYRYDVHDYKLTPSWLNARYWANPERWDKERW